MFDDDDDYWYLGKMRIYMENKGIDEENVILVFDGDDDNWYLMKMRVYM